MKNNDLQSVRVRIVISYRDFERMDFELYAQVAPALDSVHEETLLRYDLDKEAAFIRKPCH